MPPTLETSDYLSPKQKKRLIELIIEKFTESETFGWEKKAKKTSGKHTRGLKSEMPIAKNSGGEKEIIKLKDFFENEIFPIIGVTETFSDVKTIIRRILAQIDADINFNSEIKSIEKNKIEKMKKIFEDVFSILKDEVYNERMRELAGKLKGVTDKVEPKKDAKVIHLFGPEGRKR